MWAKSFAGEIVRSPIDMVIGNDITTPISIKAFEDGGFENWYLLIQMVLQLF